MGAVPGEQLTIDLRFTYTARDDLGILRTKVKDGD